MPKEPKKRVFLSYAHENLDMVRKIDAGLRKRKLDVWFDKLDMAPGSWKRQIEKAIPKCRYFIICISKAALKKIGDESSGFQDEELQQAYEIARVQPEGSFAIVPVRLEDCDRGDHRTTPYQQYDLFENFESGLDHLAINLGGISLSDSLAKDTRSEDKKLFDNLINKGMALWYSSNYDAAMLMFDACLETQNDNFLPLFCKGHLLMQRDRYDKAIEAFEKAIEIRPDHADSWHNKGYLLRELGQYDEAVEAYTRALEIEPDCAPSWIIMGCFLSEIGRKNEAVDACTKALEIAPDYEDAWYLKGVCLSDLTRNDEAQECLAKAEMLRNKKKN